MNVQLVQLVHLVHFSSLLVHWRKPGKRLKV
nr:MAG TPA: hypothetical protein [Caudoviricetes sp.]